MTLRTFDNKCIEWSTKFFPKFARVALFLVYFWFGFLKVIGQSPASQLVQHLFEKTIPFMSFPTFLILFGIFECLIGILFLIRGAERLAICLVALHMIPVFLPLILLPQEMWTGFLIPTLEGQYIIKNVLLIAVVIGITAQLQPRAH